MTIDAAIKGLTFEMILQTGDYEHAETYKLFLTRALTIGMDHFSKNMDEIVAFDISGHEVGRYRNAYEASAKLGVARGNINQILSGKKHSIHGYMFRRAKDYNFKQ
jgi:hypothetical protein